MCEGVGAGVVAGFVLFFLLCFLVDFVEALLVGAGVGAGAEPAACAKTPVGRASAATTASDRNRTFFISLISFRRVRHCTRDSRARVERSG